MKFAIIRERKNPPDRRVVFTPEQLSELNNAFAKAEFIVESSPIRIFKDEDYAAHGMTVVEDVTSADVMIGVKEVPIDSLIPQKKYFFFSHTIKKQPYNRDLLRAILDKKIELYDHETIVKKSGARLIGFGRYAGIVGAYNGFRALGLRDSLFDLPKVESLADYAELKQELSKIKSLLPALRIVMTGSGKVAGGIREILEELEIKELAPNEYEIGLDHTDQPVFTCLDVIDYYKKKDGHKPTKQEVYEQPELLESDFMKYAQITDMLITGHFYGNNAPYFFTREDMKGRDFKISLVADVSCDIDGPIACTIRPSTIADPIYGYDPLTEKEADFKSSGVITVMAVDNLPCELPKDASEGFGEMFAKHVIPAFYNGDKDGVLARAQMTTSDGKLTPNYAYLQDFVDG
jgi:alanine dehydrogenase